MAGKPTWLKDKGVYQVGGFKASYNPSGNVYWNPSSNEVFYQNSAGTTLPIGNNEGEKQQWRQAFSSVQGQDPGTTDTGQTYQGNKLMQSPQGTYYYQQGGKNYALNSDQLKGLNLPNIAGYDQSGNPYYSTPTESSKNTPQTNALADLQKTDPGTYGLINNLQKFYGKQGQQLADPRQQNALNSYYQGQAQNLSKGLDPTTLNQIQQDSRAAQVARGNEYGPSQAVQEALTTGQAGINLRSQEAQNLNSYLGGQTQSGQSYLNSGTTPIAMGSRQLSDIINQYQGSNQQTPFQSTYNPQNNFSYYNPNSGSQFAQGANNWYSNANYAYLGAGQLGGQGGNVGSSLGSAGAGALSGGLSGAAAGSVIPGVGTLIGGGIGALAGGLGGYASGGGFR